MLASLLATLRIGPLGALAGTLAFTGPPAPQATDAGPPPDALAPPQTETTARSDADEAAALRRRVVAGAAFAEGVRAFEAGDYDTAIAAFSAADDLIPHPYTRFNLGLAQVRGPRRT